MTNFLNSLNKEQLKAVTINDESSLIIAGAGSGKTKVLTSRVAWLINQKKATAKEILAVTFTNKAAKEMVERLNTFNVETAGMWVGTFHGISNKFLRFFHEKANLPKGFQILDVDDSKSLLKRIYKEYGLSDEKFPIKEAYSYISNLKESGISVEKLEIKDYREMYKKDVYEKYQNQLQKEGLVDFSDLLFKTVELLKENDDIRFWCQKRFKYILIDEFQDTNKIQYRWIKLISGLINPVFAVGDDDQSIYMFRGAKVENINNFIKDFDVNEENIIKLEQNYRSHGNILTAANSLIKKNSGRLGKNLWTNKDSGKLIAIKSTETETEEGDFIANEIKSMKSSENIKYNEIAILYRTNAQSRALEHCFFRSGIPYKVHGGLRFFERAEIKNLLGYLRLAANNNDDSACLRIINFPTKGIGIKTIEKFSSIAIKENISLFKSIKNGAEKESGKLKESLLKFIAIIEEIKNISLKNNLVDIIEKSIEISGLESYYSNIKDELDRLENLKELISAAKLLSNEKGFKENSKDVLEEFLSYAALESGGGAADNEENAVNLMTVHSAKGLEFDYVFIAGVEDGIFPHANSLGKRETEEEERRLMYVAITRAKKELVLSWAKKRMIWGQTIQCNKSRFLREIPDYISIELSGKVNNSNIKPALKSIKNDNIFMEPNASKESKCFKINNKVLHNKFGVGVIKSISGNGDALIYEIDFKEHGKRKLVGLYAKLELIK